MNKLEQYIRSNRDRFDAVEPARGHMERFRNRLPGSDTRLTLPLFTRIPYGLKIASVLILVAVSSVLIYEQAQRFYFSRQEPLQEVLPGEYLEAKLYYTSLIREKYSEIDRLSLADPERNEILLKEMGEMDRLFHSLMKDLQTNPSDERILSAMITHYQMKIDVMDQIITQLEKVNEINSTYKSHEKTDV